MRTIQKYQYLLAIGILTLLVVGLKYLDCGCHTFSQSVRSKGSKGHRYKLEVPDNSDLREEATAKLRLEARKSHLQAACDRMVLEDNVAYQRNLSITLAYGKLKLCHLENIASEFMKEIGRQENSNTIGSTFKSFIIARDPYSHLLSGYIQRMFLDADWWNTYGKYITLNFRTVKLNLTRGDEGPFGSEDPCSSSVSFYEFIRFWVNSYETNVQANYHFKPMHRMCRMCYFRYDYYVHLETLEDDLAFIYEEAKVKRKRNPSGDKKIITDSVNVLINHRDLGRWGKCQTPRRMFTRLWWVLQLRGLISKDIAMPLDRDQCKTILPDDFRQIVLDAYRNSQNSVDREKQRREIMAKMYLQIPFIDRLKIRDILMPDFKLHGYDPTPRDLFPELF